jgi:hypothetical protein
VVRRWWLRARLALYHRPRVADLPKNPEDSWCSIALAPDGKSVVVPRHEGEKSDIMLVEDFRSPTE